jgi:serine phosphatase RsbU (regulator of sigma subunit)
MNQDDLRNDPDQRWSHAAAVLRSHREAQRLRWGDVDEAMIARFVTGFLGSQGAIEEQQRVLRAIVEHPELLDCIETVLDALSGEVRHERLERSIRFKKDRLARQVGHYLLPRSSPELLGYQFFAERQAPVQVRWDYYDFIPISDDRMAIVIADVSGGGMRAVQMLAMLRNDVRHCILTKGSPGSAADALNTLLYEAGVEERFITLCLGMLDTKAHCFTFTSAGHLPVLVRRAGGHVEDFGHGLSGFPLGIMPESNYQQTAIDLAPGDVVVLYSDAITDSRDVREELYDTVENPRLRRCIGATVGDAEAVGRAIIDDIREFEAGGRASIDGILKAGPRHYSDITLLCFGPHREGTQPN